MNLGAISQVILAYLGDFCIIEDVDPEPGKAVIEYSPDFVIQKGKVVRGRIQHCNFGTHGGENRGIFDCLNSGSNYHQPAWDMLHIQYGSYIQHGTVINNEIVRVTCCAAGRNENIFCGVGALGLNRVNNFYGMRIQDATIPSEGCDLIFNEIAFYLAVFMTDNTVFSMQAVPPSEIARGLFL